MGFRVWGLWGVEGLWFGTSWFHSLRVSAGVAGVAEHEDVPRQCIEDGLLGFLEAKRHLR